jgi:hypothetical protein
MRFLSIVVCLTWLTICVASSVYAKNTVPADKPDAKESSDVHQDKPLQEYTQLEQRTTGKGETDSDDARPRTRDDVLREILSSHPSDKHVTVPPR